MIRSRDHRRLWAGRADHRPAAGAENVPFLALDNNGELVGEAQ